jgi:transcriptional regulator with XRE-family HTH domain
MVGMLDVVWHQWAMPYTKRTSRKSSGDGGATWRKLPTRLLLARGAQGYSQADLSRESGVADSLLSRIENEERPSLAAETLFRLATALQVRPEWLWRGTGPMMADGSDDMTSHEVLAEAVEKAHGRFHSSVIATANVFARGGERHTVDGWLTRLDEIQGALRSLLPVEGPKRGRPSRRSRS